MSTPADNASRGVNDEGPRVPAVRHPRASVAWASAVVAMLFALPLVAVLQNTEPVTFAFLSASGALPLGVPMSAAVAGALAVASGTARVARLPRTPRRSSDGRCGHR